MSHLSINASVSYVRKCAKNVGLTFKTNGVKLNGRNLYALYVRETGEKLIDNYLISSAYNDACSGYIESWDGSKFTGTNEFD